jgi:hypothetical protein
MTKQLKHTAQIQKEFLKHAQSCVECKCNKHKTPEGSESNLLSPNTTSTME